MHSIEQVPTWKIVVLLPVIGIAFATAWLLSKQEEFRLRNFVKMDAERKSMLNYNKDGDTL